jgi:hypothetical protein
MPAGRGSTVPAARRPSRGVALPRVPGSAAVRHCVRPVPKPADTNDAAVRAVRPVRFRTARRPARAYSFLIETAAPRRFETKDLRPMLKMIASTAAALAALTTVAVAGPFDPAKTSHDLRIEAQLKAAPAAAVVSAEATFYDPAVKSSDDRSIVGSAGVTFIATHDAVAVGYVPTIDRAVSDRD